MIDYSKHTVLIVDDEIEILKSLNRGLHSEPYDKIFVSSGAQAIDAIKKDQNISVILTDMRMPGMNGLELLKLVDQINPKIVKIVLTGYTQLPQILATVNSVEIFKFMTKPWDLEIELKSTLKAAIEEYEFRTLEENRLISSEKKGVLYHKMLSESYEKVDYILKLYDELIKVLNQHHLITVQQLLAVKDIEVLGHSIQHMNERVHYVNRIFEMSRYTLKTFDLNELKDTLYKGVQNLNISSDQIVVDNKYAEMVFYDNFKMLSSIVIDRLEVLHINSSGFFGLKIKVEKTQTGDVIRFTFEAGMSQKLKEVLQVQEKFVESVIKILGGKYSSFEVDQMIKMEMLMPVRSKPVEALSV